MVNGIFTIPLPGHGGQARGVLSGTERALPEFVAGPENVLAATALRPFLDGSTTDYNPLALYGPHGSGKSHLARGLAGWWQRHFPESKVYCRAASEFVHEYAAALDAGRLTELRQQIASADLLVLEDLGQLGGRRGAQKELVRILDDLADRGAMVVVTSRTLPAHAQVLIPPLQSRLSAGLTVGLTLPAPATRRAILERVAAVRGTTLSKKALHDLAKRLHATVPTLLAAVDELELASRMDGRPVDLKRVDALVSQKKAHKTPSLREIAASTARYFGLKLSDLKSQQRHQPLVAGRGVAMFLARRLTDCSLEEIGKFFGGRDHTTVMHGCRRTETLLVQDRATRKALADLERMLVA